MLGLLVELVGAEPKHEIGLPLREERSVDRVEANKVALPGLLNAIPVRLAQTRYCEFRQPELTIAVVPKNRRCLLVHFSFVSSAVISRNRDLDFVGRIKGVVVLSCQVDQQVFQP